ncbi:MAG: type II toxin-antitoxin system VapC family toxin [Cyanobacteria bacterium K_DeepCast_0m_m1_088]|nr:type II toxin-antitoxin system VapC family toxin [Cyanobacteria bacterium K_DeepCast_0m_m1_088]
MLVVERILQLFAGQPFRPGKPAETIQQLPHPLLTRQRGLLLRLATRPLHLRPQRLAHGIGDAGGRPGGEFPRHGVHLRILDVHAHGAIAEDTTRVFVSAASGWEIATKVRLGKLPAASELVDDLPHLLAAQGFELLPITLRQGQHAGGYAMPHRDPFDRLLAAQAELDQLTLVSLDPALQAFPCRLLW